ncbi:MAG: 1-phosphofructokinase family hexose kinase [Anaerolineae bacterium]
MILTLTPNPTIDRAVFVRGFALDAVVRAERETVTPSGKGVDASLVLHELGEETLALGLNAGWTGRLLAGMLEERGIAHDLTPAQGETRTATVLIDLRAQAQSTISASTLHATARHLQALLEMLERHAGHAWGLICGGSLPPGLPANSYAQLLRRARALGLYTLLDTSGQALRSGLSGPPHVLKVNQHEFAHLDREAQALDTGTLNGQAQLVVRLRRSVEKWGLDALVVTLGAEGALLAAGRRAYRAYPPAVEVANTAGAGDALNAGLMLARCRGMSWPAALALGTAAAASVVMNDGTAICYREQVQAFYSEVRVASVGLQGEESAEIPAGGAVL